MLTVSNTLHWTCNLFIELPSSIPHRILKPKIIQWIFFLSKDFLLKLIWEPTDLEHQVTRAFIFSISKKPGADWKLHYTGRHLWKCVSGIFQFRGFYPPSLENVLIKDLVLSVAYWWLEHAAWKFRQENSFLTCNNTALSHLPHFSCAVLIFLVFFFFINSMLLNQLDRLLPHYAFQVSIQCLMKNSILLCTLWSSSQSEDWDF